MKGSEALTAVHGKNYEVRKSTSCVVVLIPDVDLTKQTTCFPCMIQCRK